MLMKIPTIIKGLFIALLVACLTHVVRTASSEVSDIIIGCIGLAIVSYLAVRYRTKSQRDAMLVANGLNHYRQHIHHKRLIKKTS
jgi:uncharacterized protein YacL